MELRNHPGVHGKRDYYPFDPRLLKVDPQFNVRDLSTPEAIEKLAELKESIRANGVKVPLEIRFTGEDVYIVSGHRRHRAVMDLIEEGEPIETVLVISEPKGTNEADRVLNLVTSNSGEPLKPLEVAEVVRRLVAFGWEHLRIARRMGWKSAASVNQYLDMLAMPEGVKEHVRKGEVSATLARKIVKESDSEETAEDRIKANLEENKRIKKGLQKVTPKSLKRDAEKKKSAERKLSPDIQVGYESPSAASTLPAEQQPAASLELPPASVPGVSAAEEADLVAGLDPAPTEELHQATLAKVERHNGWHPDKEPEAQHQQAEDAHTAALISDLDLPENVRVLLDDLEHPERESSPDLRGRAASMIRSLASHAGVLDVMAEVGFTGTMRKGGQVEFLVQAVEPFAAAVELNDLGERPDDDVVEIPIRDLKRAWRAYTQATGGQL